VDLKMTPQTKNNTIAFNWTDDAYDKFSTEFQNLSHNYHKSSLFSDEALITLLDEYPRKWLQCYTMGNDPTKRKEWTAVHIDKLSGEEIFAAVKKGRIWINVIHIQEHQKYDTLIEEMYKKINAKCKNITRAKPSFSALIISSPKVQVYYHLDADPNMLWHLKGNKRVWVYPEKNEAFATQDFVEEVIAGMRNEDLPYHSELDNDAHSILLEPGQVLSWPQHAPHRIENIDLNVSLTTSYQSRESIRLNSVHLANYHFLKPLGFKDRTTDTDGLIAALKEVSYRGINKTKILKKETRSSNYASDLVADPSSESGLTKQAESSRTVFSY